MEKRPNSDRAVIKIEDEQVKFAAFCYHKIVFYALLNDEEACASAWQRLGRFTREGENACIRVHQFTFHRRQPDGHIRVEHAIAVSKEDLDEIEKEYVHGQLERILESRKTT